MVDGRPLRGQHLLALRRRTAWVDPAVQLWNRSLFDNLRYGTTTRDPGRVGSLLEQAELFDVLEKLPHGLQTVLGEGGGLVAGGEGQRVRLGRALYRDGIRLVILDEPFRGLDRDRRRELLTRVRALWRDATLLFISHDIERMQEFARVLVIENGRVVEDGVPSTLLAQPHSRYLSLLRAEERVRAGIWDGAAWRRLWLADGQLHDR
jgi:ABC-type multidrug transport system fused ATPase/permease subunit